MLKVTCAIIIHDKKILVAQRSKNSDHPFQWEFPGGKILPGESPGQCIVREIKEELEIEIEITEQLTSVIFDYGHKKIELIPFICHWIDGEIRLNEHVALKWITTSEFEETNFPGADRKLISYRENLFSLKKYFGKYKRNT